MQAIRFYLTQCLCASLRASLKPDIANKVNPTKNCVIKCDQNIWRKIMRSLSGGKRFGFLGPMHLRSASSRRRLTSTAQFQTLPALKRLPRVSTKSIQQITTTCAANWQLITGKHVSCTANLCRRDWRLLLLFRFCSGFPLKSLRVPPGFFLESLAKLNSLADNF